MVTPLHGDEGARTLLQMGSDRDGEFYALIMSTVGTLSVLKYCPSAMLRGGGYYLEASHQRCNYASSMGRGRGGG